ncbi:hypothetical protein L484_026631 [Morus notabilis]|uniref:UspA domain-containing protein n=1 Tax=Morus notabilis TaxID=981085 RepID=W9SCL4_9ROSA|nr:uncharacterized protein LOC21409278 [Morus notabilis]EXC35308.1 hypothetical protein L484_026631 [Morus notabilis]
MTLSHYPVVVPVERTSIHAKTPIPASSASEFLFSAPFSSASLSFTPKARKISFFSNYTRLRHKTRAQPQEADVSSGEDAFTGFKHLLLPITDRNPYLSEGTRQAVATTASLAKKYGADITVVVIDEQQKETLPEHETQLSSIRWHLSEGGFQEFRLLEQLGAGKKPTAIIGEVADDLNLDLVVISMEAIHSKHVDANLLAEFIPCPVILLPL